MKDVPPIGPDIRTPAFESARRAPYRTFRIGEMGAGRCRSEEGYNNPRGSKVCLHYFTADSLPVNVFVILTSTIAPEFCKHP